MKKLLIILPILFLLAAGCNNSEDSEDAIVLQPMKSSAQTPNPIMNTIDEISNGFNQSVTTEEQLSLESDSMIINSDKSEIIKSSEEVYNESAN